MIDGTTSAEDVVHRCLDHMDYPDAIFLAECLFAQVPSSSSLTLLATCYSRAGKMDSLFCLLNKKIPLTPLARFLMLKCCIELNKYHEGEELLGCVHINQVDFDELFGTAAPFALHLYSVIYRETGRLPQASECIKRALDSFPFLWTAYKEAHGMMPQDGIMAHQLSPQDVFSNKWTNSIETNENIMPPSNTPNNSLNASSPMLAPLPMTPALQDPATSPLNTPNDVTPQDNLMKPIIAHAPKKLGRRSTAASNMRQTRLSLASNARAALSQSNQTQVQTRSKVKGGFKENSNSGSNILDAPRKNAVTHTIGGRTRSSRRVSTVDQMNARNSDSLNSLIIQPPTISSSPSSSTSSSSNYNNNHVTACGLLDTLRSMGELYTRLWKYDCTSVIELANQLHDLAKSPMVMAAKAQAHMENADYDKAAAIFGEMRDIHGHYLDGVELYSTTLWHMQKESQLSSLAQDLTENYKHRPQTWCVVGNSFSLAKEHDNAIKFFTRAVQMDPNFTYAYTLLGHEYIAIDSTDKAEAAFRSAIRIQPRNYIAWFGLGLIFYKREQLPLALHHFKYALNINPTNSVLMCHLSVVLQALEKPRQALNLLDKALESSPNNVLCRYHRAQLLCNNNRLEDALKELEHLKLLVPREPRVFFLSGKVHRKLGNVHDSLIDLCWSTELDPRGEQHNPLVGDRRYEDEPVTALAADDNAPSTS